jgi:uncharacterized coiled-coil protein SlyX
MSDIEKQIEELTRQLTELRSWQSQMNTQMVLLEKQLENLKVAVLPYSKPSTASENFSSPGGTVATKMPYVHHKQRFV